MSGSERDKRMIVKLPALRWLRTRTSCRDLDARIGNPELDDLAWFTQAATGTFVHMHRDDSRSSYAAVLESGRVLDVAARVIGWAMAVEGRASDWLGFHAATTALPQMASAASTQSIIAELGKTVVSLAFGDDGERDEGLVTLAERPRLSWSPPPFDFFISYKHRFHAAHARGVTTALRERGFSCFIDEDDLPPEAVRADLYGALRRALDVSRCTVFFETMAQSTVDEDVAGRWTASSVHAFELHHAKNVITVRLEPPEVYTRAGDWRRSWSGVEELVDVLAGHLGFADGGASRGAPRLGPVLDAARGCVTRALATDVDVAPLAALALAASDRVDVRTSQTFPARGAAVFTTLLRLDLATSLALEEAGVPPEAWAAATAAWPEAAWRTPYDGLMETWPEDVVDDLRRRVDRYQVFDEAALATGMLGEARHPRSSAGGALRRALRALPQPTDLSDEDLEVQVSDVIERAVRILANRGGVPRHGWLSLTGTDGSAREVPVSRCGPFRVAPLATDHEVVVELLARQDEDLYPATLVDELAGDIRAAAEADRMEAEWLAGIFPAVALTIEAAGRQVEVVDVSMEGDGSLLLTVDAAPPDGMVGRVRSVLPEPLARPVTTGTLRCAAGDELSTPLDDLLALWDLCARANEHLAVRDRDPAAHPTGRGEVAPTASAAGPGSLWPPPRGPRQVSGDEVRPPRQ